MPSIQAEQQRFGMPRPARAATALAALARRTPIDRAAARVRTAAEC